MPESHFEPHPTRKNPALSLLAGVVFLAISHFTVRLGPAPLKLLTVLGSLFTVLGLGGVVDPRCFFGLMPEAREHYPAWVPWVSYLLVLAGFGLGIFLLSRVYRVFP